MEITYCFDYLPSRILEEILRNDCNCGNASFLSQNALLHICSILAGRHRSQSPSEIPDPDASWKELMRTISPSDIDKKEE